MCLLTLVRPPVPLSLDPRPSPAHSLGLSFGVGSPSALGHSLSKTQSLSPWYIFWDVSHLEMRVTRKSLGSPRGPLGKYFSTFVDAH